MRIKIQVVGRARKKWDTDPRVRHIAADAWYFLEKVASGHAPGYFVGEVGEEVVKLRSGVKVTMQWWREGPGLVWIVDIHIVK